jgi:DNA-binding transcriptional MerR regulator
MAEPIRKSDHAFRTIGELAGELGVPQHILRYWETRFPQLKPLQRAGNRRYYRPDDVALARRIHGLLNTDGYTIRGVQQLLGKGAAAAPPEARPVVAPGSTAPDAGASGSTGVAAHDNFPADALRALRCTLADALEETVR